MNAREAAFSALTAVLRDGAYTALALKKHIPNNFSTEDRHFVSKLLRTTLENLIRIDFALEGFIKTSRVHGSVRNILRLGACQLLFMDTQSYAAVSESVALAKKVKPQTAGFVNAVLRNLERGKDSIAYPKGETPQALSILSSYPLWICEKYIKDFGGDFAKELLMHKAPETTSVRMNPLKTNTADFLSALERLAIKCEPGNVPDAYAVSGLSDIENLELFTNGSLAVQSESAMRAVRAIELHKGIKLLDCCAAPGGKSAYAAALTQNDIEITAWDIHEHRVEMTKKNYERLGVAHEQTLLHDAREFEPSLEGCFDVVLVDAPCSAMGLMAHHPDIRYTRRIEDIASLCALQRDILSVCARYVKAGGKLAYMTCSINKEENEEITEAFLASADGFEYEKPPQTLYPHLSGSDGFFFSIMRKK